MFFFFFSSRRRHTRLTCDWSSDVCSSDLQSPPSSHHIARNKSLTRSRPYMTRDNAEVSFAGHSLRMPDSNVAVTKRVDAYFARKPILMTRRASRFLGGSLAFADAAVPALALLKFEQSLKQPRAAEIRPERFGDKNLRVGDLPKQKIAHAHLAAGADQQVGVRQAFG